MFQRHATVAMEFEFVDRDERGSRLTLRLPFSTPEATLHSIANLFVSRLRAISDAVLYRYHFRWRIDDDAPPTPGPQSDVGCYMVLYYSNGADIEPIFIPSPNPDVLEQSGDFAGIRLDLGNPAVAFLADALTAALLQTLGPDAELWERQLLVGGRTR